MTNSGNRANSQPGFKGWQVKQKAFSAALQAPGDDPPKSLKRCPGGTAPNKRFNVYRNNVALSLINILRDVFPVTEALVGPDFFTTLARHFIAAHLPETPMMFKYGNRFPAFIKNYQPAKGIRYLSDIAALEWAANEALYAADAAPLAIDELSRTPEATLPDLRLTLHPSLRCLTSDWPIVSIWQAHQQDHQEQSLQRLPAEGEAALICRPKLSVTIKKVTPASATFINALNQGATFGGAVEVTLESHPGFDIPANLAVLFNSGGVVALSHQPDELNQSTNERGDFNDRVDQ